MEFKLDVNRLEKDELTYELAFCGITDKKTVEEMRKCLRAILRLERTESSLTYPQYPFTFEDDAVYIETKMSELQNLISGFSGSDTSSLHSKISSKLAHVFKRAERSKSSTDAQHIKRSNFLIELSTLQSQLKSKVKKFKRSSQNSETPEELTAFMSSTTLNSDTDNNSSSDEEAVFSKNLSGAQPTGNPIKSVPVSKWNITKFSGDNIKISLGAFLENVEEVRMSRNVSESQLLNSASDLFTGKALIWFRSIKPKIHSWANLVDELRSQFQTPQFNEKLIKEIKQRTQGPDETIGIYILPL
ncbi:hypothetical protein NQ315_012915 [Exocentrus adspersus]|uniref:Retrotransposon gag domain-containing protein n=1 Tax=Exocentrus adspersus TaxID=1586481 RepID=A0AAV8VS92_9CUCU|nr:hypothetical protein NQ315_012915 [Exocentrus adspersus]